MPDSLRCMSSFAHCICYRHFTPICYLESDFNFRYIYIANPKGRKFGLYVSIHQTVGHIKQLIFDAELNAGMRIEAKLQLLTYQGRLMSDNYTLAAYGVSLQATLRVSVITGCYGG